MNLPGLRPDRIPVLPGGFAIMSAVFSELDITHMTLATGAMRQGVLYDMLGRFHDRDMRDTTVAQFMKRYHVDVKQARRVEALALSLLRQFSGDLRAESEYPLRLVSWAAWLHEIGLSVAHTGYHKHSAYILTFADMPGFSKMEQAHLSLLVLAHRGTVEKVKGQISDSLELAMVMAMRLAVLFHRSRTDVHLPPLEAHCDGRRFQLGLDAAWLAATPHRRRAQGGSARVERSWREPGGARAGPGWRGARSAGNGLSHGQRSSTAEQWRALLAPEHSTRCCARKAPSAPSPARSTTRSARGPSSAPAATCRCSPPR